jgi:uncharacterized protein
MSDQADPTATLDLTALKAYFETREDVAFALLYGSHARGRAGPLSDVDVGVYLTGAPDGAQCFDVRLRMIVDLMGVLKTDDVDVAILNQTPLALTYRVFRDGVLLSCNDRRAMIEFKARALSEYLDFLPILERHNRAILERARTGRLLDGYNPRRGSLERHRRLRERLAREAKPELRRARE